MHINDTKKVIGRGRLILIILLSRTVLAMEENPFNENHEGSFATAKTASLEQDQKILDFTSRLGKIQPAGTLLYAYTFACTLRDLMKEAKENPDLLAILVEKIPQILYPNKDIDTARYLVMESAYLLGDGFNKVTGKEYLEAIVRVGNADSENAQKFLNSAAKYGESVFEETPEAERRAYLEGIAARSTFGAKEAHVILNKH